ncbi:hypothetical protein D9757_014845 [Collybiopsis confluens]|uniref:Fatty acid synthase beta subunit n=1 Tax=Collybiopsis confluens TaxID=2823264 RepID=A0A8H5CBZ2_9AGAR|nr:hypothetical protein D9757_014845 [Collybiopsis confluens]
MATTNTIDSCSSISMRPVIISLGKLRLSIPVSTKSDEWISAEVLRDEFIHQQSLVDAVDTTADLENQAEATVELAARFLGFVASRVLDNTECKAARTSLLFNVFKHFTSSYLSSEDVHSLASSYDTGVRKVVLSSYFSALSVLQEQKAANIPTGPKSALFAAAASGDASIYALFGGQGTNEVYIDELQSLFDIYRPFVASFISSMSEVLVPLAEEKQQFSPFYTHGLDVYSWLSGATYRPSTSYLASVPATGLTPGELSDRLAGATGHSQGIVSAVAAAASTSFESFAANSKKALRWLFFCGYRGQEAFPVVSLEPSLVQDSIDGGEGTPSPMLSITGLSLPELEPHLAKTNKHLPENSRLQVTLHNGPRALVVTGPARALHGLVVNLRKIRAPLVLTKAKSRFRNASHVYLAKATDKVIEEDLEGDELWKPEELRIPVSTRKMPGFDFAHSLDQGDEFPKSATHALDFGPGGVRVIVIGERGKGDAELYNPTSLVREDNWVEKYSPRLVKSKDGTIHLDTPFSRLLGKPRSCYHVEWLEVDTTTPAHFARSSASSSLFARAQERGLPIEGFCIGAGIPSTEKAAEIVEGLKSAGIKHLALKPGSVDGIRQVINIAAANPGFPIICQWTGGRAGGHHSFEDFHQPILATYRAIRKQENVILVGGSGFGDAEDVWPYLNGDWSLKYGVQPMPYDGFLFGSRVMVAKEAHTSSSVKDLLVASPGVDDGQWEGTYSKATGGVLTVRSELGEPIHKLPKEKRAAWLNEHHDEVIQKLNRDFSKPWFGAKKDGSPAELRDMTYEETVLRMVRLMYVAHEKRWVDITLRNLTGDWLRRIEERLQVSMAPAPNLLFFNHTTPSMILFLLSKTSSRLILLLPTSCFPLMIPATSGYSQRRGQKPVPFIPVLDATFEVCSRRVQPSLNQSPGSVDGDLLKLVHLSNSFRMVNGAKPFQAGDVCRSEAKIVSVVNSQPGRF